METSSLIENLNVSQLKVTIYASDWKLSLRSSRVAHRTGRSLLLNRHWHPPSNAQLDLEVRLYESGCQSFRSVARGNESAERDPVAARRN